MNNKQPNSRRNLDIAIERVLGQDSNPLQARTIIANTIVGQLLPAGAVKGGSALKFRYGDKSTRFSRDFDTARQDDLHKFIDDFQNALTAGWHGFTGKIVKKDPAKPKNVPDEYIMQPFEIKLSYNGKSWLTVPLEVGHDEIGDTDTPDFFISQEIVDIFIKLGFPEPIPVALMPINHQIAQKLHALSLIDSDRAHDLIDLQVIANHEIINYRELKSICRRLFDSRKQQLWPPIINKTSIWDALYVSQVYDSNVFQNVDDAVIWVNNFIEKIDKA